MQYPPTAQTLTVWLCAIFHQPELPMAFAYLPVPLTVRQVPAIPEPLHSWASVHWSPSLSLKVHVLVDAPVVVQSPLAR